MENQEINFENIILYSVKGNNIIAILDDEEKIKLFATGATSEAPIVVLPYSKEMEYKVLSSMKKISSYALSEKKDIIEVTYTDGKVYYFDDVNLTAINQNLKAQRELSQQNVVVGNWTNLTPEKKENNKKDVKRKVIKGIAGTLAAAAILGGGYIGAKHIKEKHNDSEDPRKTEEDVRARSKFANEGKALYKEIEANTNFDNFQKSIGQDIIKIDEDTAINIAEMINGVYPTSMLYMKPENAQAELEETRQTINLILAYNLFPDVKEDSMIDLSAYVSDDKSKAMMHNSLVLARTHINEMIGEPTNGKILEEDEWSEVNKFSTEYKNAVDQLLHYELDTINDSAFLEMPAGPRFVIGSIFQNANNTVPMDSYVTRKSFLEPKESRVYFCYYSDNHTKKVFLPVINMEGSLVYIDSYIDKDGNCIEDTYTQLEMEALAGLATTDDERETGITPNPNILQIGILNEVNSRVDEAIESLDNLVITSGLSK